MKSTTKLSVVNDVEAEVSAQIDNALAEGLSLSVDDQWPAKLIEAVPDGLPRAEMPTFNEAPPAEAEPALTAAERISNRITAMNSEIEIARVRMAKLKETHAARNTAMAEDLERHRKAAAMAEAAILEDIASNDSILASDLASFDMIIAMDRAALAVYEASKRK
jgi:hypothetical protein